MDVGGSEPGLAEVIGKAGTKVEVLTWRLFVGENVHGAFEAAHVLPRLAQRYPEMQVHLDEGIAVAINGNIYRDDWTQAIPAGAEVFLISTGLITNSFSLPA